MWVCPKCSREFKASNQHHYCGDVPKSIDEYLEPLDTSKKDILQSVRKAIREAAPKAVERISWNMPTFWQDGNLIHFAASKNHFGLYPGDEAIVFFSDRLEEGGLSFRKGTIQFPWDKPVPYGLIKEITAFCVAKAEQKKK